MIYRYLALLVCLTAFGAAPVVAEPASINETFKDVGAITTADGINEQRYVKIGGISQWISVRSRHKGNPVLLFLHGGPGFTSSPVSYYYMRDWEEYFTVVQWDQRGAGKTFKANDQAAVVKTMTVDRLVDDADELVDVLLKTYGQDKGQNRVVLMAHSFGTVIGTKLAQLRPERFYAYVSMGQFVDFARSEAMGYAATLKDAKAANNAEAVADLARIAPFPDPLHPERNLQNLGTERRWLATYGGYYWRGFVGHNGQIAQYSPDHTAADLKARDEGQGFSDTALWDSIGHINLSRDNSFKVPVIIMQGRHDRGTAASLVDEWYASLKAPAKKLIWFEDSAHMVYEEEPGRVLVTLVNDVLPLTRAAAKPGLRAK